MKEIYSFFTSTISVVKVVRNVDASSGQSFSSSGSSLQVLTGSSDKRSISFVSFKNLACVLQDLYDWSVQTFQTGFLLINVNVIFWLPKVICQCWYFKWYLTLLISHLWCINLKHDFQENVLSRRQWKTSERSCVTKESLFLKAFTIENKNKQSTKSSKSLFLNFLVSI